MNPDKFIEFPQSEIYKILYQPKLKGAEKVQTEKSLWTPNILQAGIRLRKVLGYTNSHFFWEREEQKIELRVTSNNGKGSKLKG
jgi:hypothetical protein